MEIILKQDVDKLGHKDEVVRVKSGYARNYLIPQGFAVMATKSALKIHQENLKQKAHKEAKYISDAEAAKAKIEGKVLTIGAKTSSTGKIFGSVNTIMIAEALEKEGITVDRKNITIKSETVKEVGTYDAVIKLYKHIKTEIKFEVIAE